MKPAKVQDTTVFGKRILLRADFDVPLNKDGKITDDTRIKNSFSTINYLLNQKAKIILIAHLGRPGGQRDESLSLRPVSERLSELLKRKILFSDEILGSKTKKLISKMDFGEIVLLENLRFDSREEENDKNFSKELSSLADLYVNEAFSVSHRKHSSIAGVLEFMPFCFGFYFQKEIKALDQILNSPKRPVLLILGGKKKSKLDQIGKLKLLVDKIAIGGKLPLLGKDFSSKDQKIIVANLTQNNRDISALSIDEFKKEIAKAGTIILAGTMGVFEEEENEAGTREIIKALALSLAFTVAGGGDTQAALTKFGLTDRIDYISSGGGAMLFYLAQKTLPALEK
ncbi:MAG: phosphoglycerate kinase [Patescibacteria group bacterium]